MVRQYITDESGDIQSVIIPYLEYQKILENLDEIDDIKEYLLAKKEKSELIPLDTAFDMI
jgi:hypothetical protein